MNILNTLRKPYFAVFISAIMLFVSCSDSDNSIEPNTFDFNTFETYKNTNLKIGIPENVSNIVDLNNRYEQINLIINSELGSDIQLNELDQLYLNNYQFRSNNSELPLNFLNENDLTLINSFENDLSLTNFNTAILNLQNNILALNLDNIEFQKYNYFVNVLLLLENQEPGILSNSNSYSSRLASPCGEAIAAYSLATIGLSACWMTGPGAPLFCGAAIAAKVLAYRAMLRDCAD